MGRRYIFFIIITGLAAFGCDQFLDTEPTEGYPETTVWSTPETVDAFVIGNYSGTFSPYVDFISWDKTFSNNMVNCRAACPSEARGLMDNTYDWGLSGRFTYIRNCNLIIEKMEESDIDDYYKSKYVAEAKMMRAMIYYDLARKGGRYMWVDKVLDQNDDFNVPLTDDIVESYKHVLTDLRDAIEDLPETATSGRLTKNAGLAFLSEVCLTAAAYTENDSSLYKEDGKDLYQEAVDAVDSISGVSLDNSYEDMFNQVGAYDSSEIILARYWSKDNTTMSDTDMINLVSNVLNENLTKNNCGPLFNNSDIFECWLDHTPSQNLVDDYLVIDESTGKAVRWYESSQFINNTVEISASEAKNLIGSIKDEDEFSGDDFRGYKLKEGCECSISDLMYDNRDKRFDASIIRDGSSFLGETIAMCVNGNMSRYATASYGSDHVTITNYCIRKYVYTDWDPRPFYNVYTDYHKILFRYGRALLNKAEALLRLNDVSEAVKTLNLTRVTHGGLPESQATSLSDAWNDYKIERRVELFWEGDWYFSLLRWGKYGYEANDGKSPGSTIDELTEPSTFIEISSDRTVAFVGEVQFSNNDRAFDTRSYLFPITRSIIQANSAIEESDQNLGWE